MRFSVLFLVLASATLYLCDASQTILIDASIVIEDGINITNEKVEDKQQTREFQGALPPASVCGPCSSNDDCSFPCSTCLFGLCLITPVKELPTAGKKNPSNLLPGKVTGENEEVEHKQQAKKFQGALPPVPEESLTAKNCPCNKLLLSSLGPTKDHLSGVMGVYTKYGEYNSKPAYFGPNSTRLYFLPSGWLVSDSVGKPTGFIHNGNKSRNLCAYEIPDGWLFFSAQWYQDTTLVLRCIP